MSPPASAATAAAAGSEAASAPVWREQRTQNTELHACSNSRGGEGAGGGLIATATAFRCGGEEQEKVKEAARDESTGERSFAGGALLRGPWSSREQQHLQHQQAKGLRHKSRQQQESAAAVPERSLWLLSAFVEGSSRLLSKRHLGVRADLLQRLLPDKAGEAERHIHNVAVAVPPDCLARAAGGPAAAGGASPLALFSPVGSSAASAATGVDEDPTCCCARGAPAAAARRKESVCIYTSRAVGAPASAAPAGAADVAFPPRAPAVGDAAAADACTTAAGATAEASPAAAHAATSMLPRARPGGAATERLPHAAAAEARATTANPDTGATEGANAPGGGREEAATGEGATAAAEGGQAGSGGGIAVIEAAAAGVGRKGCGHPSRRDEGGEGAVRVAAAATGERHAGERGAREDGRSRAAAAAVASAAEARRERHRGGRYLGSRRQSRVIRRETWRKSAILRHFDTQVQPRPHAERLFFPVHALCQAEGYDLSSLYRTLLPRNCHARFLDERNTVLYVEFFDWELQLSQAKARSYECFDRWRATQKLGAAQSSSFCAGRLLLRRREGERSRSRAAAARGAAFRRRLSSDDSSSDGSSLRSDEGPQCCRSSPAPRAEVVEKALEEQLLVKQETTLYPKQQQQQQQKRELPTPQQEKQTDYLQSPQRQLQIGYLPTKQQQQQQTRLRYLQVPQQKRWAKKVTSYPQQRQQELLQQREHLQQKSLADIVEQQQQQQKKGNAEETGIMAGDGRQRSRPVATEPWLQRQREAQQQQPEGQPQEESRTTGESVSGLCWTERQQQRQDCSRRSRSADVRGSACDFREEAATAAETAEGSRLHTDVSSRGRRTSERRSSSCMSWRRRRADSSRRHRRSNTRRSIGEERGDSSRSGTESRRSSESSQNRLTGSRRSGSTSRGWSMSSGIGSSSRGSSRSRSSCSLSNRSRSYNSSGGETALLQLEQLGRRRRMGRRRRFYVGGSSFAFSPASATARSCFSSSVSLLHTDSVSLFPGEEKTKETEFEEEEEGEGQHLQRNRRDAAQSLTFALLPPGRAAAAAGSSAAPRREAGKAAEDAAAATEAGGGGAAAAGKPAALRTRCRTGGERRSRDVGEEAAAARAPQAAGAAAEAAAASERTAAAAAAATVAQRQQQQGYESREQNRAVSSGEGCLQSVSEGEGTAAAADASCFSFSASSFVAAAAGAAADQVQATDRPSCCFIFANGAVVVWGESQAEATELKREWLCSLLWLLNTSATGLVRADKSQEDVMFYCYIDALYRRFPHGKVPPARVKQNRLYLKTHSAEEKLAVSYALAQSIRLDVYEALVNSTIAQVREIPERMCRVGCGSLTRRLASEQSLSSYCYSTAAADGYGKLFADLAVKMIDVNLVQDFLDVPEVFWDDDTWQPFWQRVHDHLELQDRVDLLNTRYSYMLELLNVVRRERSRAQEFRLTWIVLVLLTAQVVATLFKFVFTSR